MGVLCLVLVLLFSTLCLSSFANMQDWEERVRCFALAIFLMSCDSQSSVALPCDATTWSAVCDGGTS